MTAVLKTFVMLLLAIALSATVLVAAAGFLVEGTQEELEPSDAIIVISGDEDLARLREGIRLWRGRWAPWLILSGAARDGPISNAAAMRRIALADGMPESAILLEERGSDTYGNALYTLQVMQASHLRSAILVTSPYHLHRAMLTFRGVYTGTGIELRGSAAPDSAWRKQTWWQSPALRQLTLSELEKLAYIALTGRYN